MANGDATSIQLIPLNKIKIGKNSRHDIKDDELAGLMQSIKETGQLMPIGVKKVGDGYHILHGNRRFLACSKLGLTKILATVHELKREADGDIVNLTENIQRRNITLAEIGRYIDLLKKENGLTRKEIAVRLGISRDYVAQCEAAFSHVPSKFRDAVEVRQGGKKLAAGKIDARTSTRLLSAGKKYRLAAPQVNMLFKAAAENSEFSKDNIYKYAASLANGKNNFLEENKKMHICTLRFEISKRHQNELERKFVDDGPFHSLNELFRAILRGEKSVKIDVMK